MESTSARTTIRLDDSLMENARSMARQRGITLTALIEEGLRLAMARVPKAAKARIELPVCRQGGGAMPGVDLNDSAAVLDAMENLG